MLAAEEAPFRVAVIVALPFDTMVPAVAAKVAEVEFAGTDTEAGTVRAPLLDDSPTVLPPVGATLDSATVHVLYEAEAKVDGLQDKENTVSGDCRLMLEVTDPPVRVAVIEPMPFEVIVPAVAVKVADVEFAGIDTEEGTERVALFEDKAMEVAAPGDTFDSVTEQDAAWFEVRLVGEQVRDERFTGACSVRVACAEALPNEAVIVPL